MRRCRSSVCSSRSQSGLSKEYFSLQFALRCVFTRPRPISDMNQPCDFDPVPALVGPATLIVLWPGGHEAIEGLLHPARPRLRFYDGGNDDQPLF